LGLASEDAGLANFPICGLLCRGVDGTKKEFAAKRGFAASNSMSISDRFFGRQGDVFGP
jgi:hypothetical protein